jgi:hypothetical protein
MRLFFTVIIFLAAAEAVDVFWFNGRYSQTLWQEVKHATNQVTSPAGKFVIPAPNLSRFWKIPG